MRLIINEKPSARYFKTFAFIQPALKANYMLGTLPDSWWYESQIEQIQRWRQDKNVSFTYHF